MTLRNDLDLFDSSKLDRAMGRTFELLRSSNQSEIESMTEVVGLPAVRLTYEWANENAKAKLGADIEWLRRQDVKLSVRVQPQQVVDRAYNLATAIAKEQIVVTGDLTHVDLSDCTFEKLVDGVRVRGTFEKAISAANPAQLPKRYQATMTVSTKISAAEGEGITYLLVRLDEPACIAGTVNLLASMSWEFLLMLPTLERGEGGESSKIVPTLAENGLRGASPFTPKCAGSDQAHIRSAESRAGNIATCAALRNRMGLAGVALRDAQASPP